MIASKHKLNNFHVIIDYNKIQSYGRTSEVMDLEPLKDKLVSFGYKVKELNGHNVKHLRSYFKSFKELNAPTALIAHTIKGKGFHFAEQNPYWHHKNFFTDQEKEQLKSVWKLDEGKTCLDTVFELAKKNKKVVFVGSDLGPGVLDNFKKSILIDFLWKGLLSKQL